MEFEIALQYGVGIIALLILLTIRILQIGGIILLAYMVYSLLLEDVIELMVENIRRKRGR